MARTCAEDGCDNPWVARQLCHKHYKRLQTSGLPSREFVNSGRTCSIDGCVNMSKRQGICMTHIERKKAGWPDWDTRPVRHRVPNGRFGDYTEWEYMLYRNYGMEKGTYEYLLEKQGGKCAICGSVECHTGRRFSVDHDHACCPENAKSCGKCVRGLLCGHCNQGIGKFKDDISLLKAAIRYLEGVK